MTYEIICADVLDWAKNYEGPLFHALICDPPWEYHFMSKDWDNTGITFQPETWSTLADILHPGAFLMVFAGSRGWHRLAVALEDAGLVLQPSIFVWGLGVVEVPLMLLHLQAQAFPKASRLRKAPKPERARRYRWLGWLGRLGNWLLRKRGEPPRYYLDFVWEGHRYGGQILKDCATPIICAQKPWDEPRLDCIVRTGAGAINVDAGRIATVGPHGTEGRKKLDGFKSGDGEFLNHLNNDKTPPNPQGRWPSNFALIHSAPGPDGEGGCVRAGTRRVKGTGVTRPYDEQQKFGKHGIYGQGSNGQVFGYADPDGMETVSLYSCQLSPKDVEWCTCEK